MKRTFTAAALILLLFGTSTSWSQTEGATDGETTADGFDIDEAGGDDTVAEEMEELDRLEADMFDRLLVQPPSSEWFEGPYEALEPVLDTGRPGSNYLPAATYVTEEELRAAPSQSAEVLSDEVELPAVDWYDLDGLGPLFGIDDLNQPGVQTQLHFWNTNGRRRMGHLLARSGWYRDMIQSELAEAGLPTELLYLVMIESGFRPRAESRASAVGLWQFIARTGRGYGLVIDRRLDERRDPERATQAAIAYLSSLHERFGSWPLAMAAYNAGGGHVLGEIRRYNVNNFWVMDAYSAVFDDTRAYVYRIIAAAIIGTNPTRFGFDGVVYESPLGHDTVTVPGNTRLRVFARAAETDVDTLRELNPSLLAASTPDVDTHELHLPYGSLDTFIANYDDVDLEDLDNAYVHILRVGETVANVADCVGLAERVVRRANGLGRRESVSYGTPLVVPMSEDEAQPLLSSSVAQLAETLIAITPSTEYAFDDAERVFYQVRRGDSLDEVARAFGVSSWDLAMWNDVDPDVVLQSQMTLQVFVRADVDLRGVRHLIADQVTVLPLGSPEFTAWDEAQTESRRARRRTYTVRRGDTLSTIARRFGVSTRDIMRWNGIENANRIRSGLELRVR